MSLSNEEPTDMSPGEALRLDEIARTRRIVVVMYGIAFTVTAALFFGLFSVAEMVVVLGIYFVSLGQSRSSPSRSTPCRLDFTWSLVP